MGALTLKNFPFTIRSWNVKTYSSIDPTDSFGQNTKVFINKNQIVKIEPLFSRHTKLQWLTDKGRQFFDGIFSNTNKSISTNNLFMKTVQKWEIFFKTINKISYIFDICNFKNANRYFFVVVFENANIEILNFLSIIGQKFAFIKLRKSEYLKLNSDLEANFQINSAISNQVLSNSSLGLVIGVNPRLEGSYLNLKLRQRYFKGNFKLLSIGSLLDLTFPASFLGSNLLILKNILEGNQIHCKDFVSCTNPILITNTESFKHKANLQKILTNVKMLMHTNILNRVWCGFNILNSSIYETGLHGFAFFPFISFKDLIFFSSLYLINVDLNNVKNLKKITESRLLSYKSDRKLHNKKLLFIQDSQINSLNILKHLLFKNYLYLPNNVFFESQESFINTEGLIKKTTKLISRKNTKNDWQLLRKFVNIFQSSIMLSSAIKNQNVFYNGKSLFIFKNFTSFHFQATQTLTNLNFYLNFKNQKFVIYKKSNRFKILSTKFFSTKLKYWLDDFYIGGKDIFSQNSLLLIQCSINYRLQITNFF